ncbi:MAG: YfcE family phosphodiesterase [Candidatus Omnitrophica bacterium]|nr:YfcE family phosphodiesterase [Candidatus Omnitrophota bacterium]
MKHTAKIRIEQHPDRKVIRLGVISDTHISDQEWEVPQKVREDLKDMDAIIHCGDLVNIKVIGIFKEICPLVFAVSGNMDLPETKRELPIKEIISAGKFKIGVTHGYGHPNALKELALNIFQDDKVDAIVFGHSHNPVNEKKNGILYYFWRTRLAAWRINYIAGKREKKCIFCRAKEKKSEDYVILDTRHSISLLNIFPYNNGHCLISPKRHTADISSLTPVEVEDLFSVLKKTKSLLDKVLKPHGYNIGINLTRAAGAGVAGHLHVHIVPRWNGDVNFMPVIAGTKVISQSLDELYRFLRKAAKQYA